MSYIDLDEFISAKPIRRFMNSDHSCLFNAVAYSANRFTYNENSANNLRKVVSEIILGNNKKYNEAILGKSNLDYANDILSPYSWGGEIELSILADYYKIEIVTLSAKDYKIKLIYGANKQYKERIYIIYDGTHYDALAINSYDENNDNLDICKFFNDDLVNNILEGKYAEMISSYYI